MIPRPGLVAALSTATVSRKEKDARKDPTILRMIPRRGLTATPSTATASSVSASGTVGRADDFPFPEANARRSSDRDSGKTRRTRIKLMKEQQMATQKTEVTVWPCPGTIVPPVPGRKLIGCLISQPPILGPTYSR